MCFFVALAIILIGYDNILHSSLIAGTQEHSNAVTQLYNVHGESFYDQKSNLTQLYKPQKLWDQTKADYFIISQTIRCKRPLVSERWCNKNLPYLPL